MPTGASPGGLPTGPLAIIAPTQAATPPDFRFTELPWLTHRENAERLETNRLLGGPGSQDAAVRWRDELRSAFEHVAGVEQDIMEADVLLQKSRTSSLSEAESQRLREIVDFSRDVLPSYGEMLDMMLLPVSNGAAADTDSERLATNLKQRFEVARRQCFNQVWEESSRRVKLVLPVGAGKDVAVESRVVPGAALGRFFPGGYPTARGPASEVPFFMHVPGLGHTSAANARGEVIYSGLCHDLAELAYLGGDLLFAYDKRRGSAPYPLGRIARDLMVTDRLCAQMGGKDPEVVANEIVESFRDAPWPVAEFMDSELRGAVARKMASEVVLAALVADPPKLSQALEGKRVGINLCWVVDAVVPQSFYERKIDSLLPFGQAAQMEETRPLELSVRDADGAKRKIQVDFRSRQFLFIDPGDRLRPQGRMREVMRWEWERLLGPAEPRDLGGSARARANEMAVRIRELRDEIAGIGREASRAPAGNSPDGPGSPGARERRSVLDAELRHLEKNRRTLLVLGQQLKDMCGKDYVMVGTVDGRQCAMYPETMARLALVSHLMGETPVIAKSGGQGVQGLDARVKFLATVADSGEGLLPPLGRDSAWDGCATGFASQIGPQAHSLVHRSAYQQQEMFGFMARRNLL